ncbi:MAG: hypothetical protein KatS3mg014_2554 [Actinomycetota bacterium]|nr:MAG: hypothetical protein KatS3mg014_2554 [Actinomycetota bacterium]
MVESERGMPVELIDLTVRADHGNGPGTGLVEQLRRMTLRTSGRSHAAVR